MYPEDPPPDLTDRRAGIANKASMNTENHEFPAGAVDEQVEAEDELGFNGHDRALERELRRLAALLEKLDHIGGVISLAPPTGT